MPLVLNDHANLISVQTRRYGMLYLRPLRYQDISFFEELEFEDLSMRSFVVRTIQHQLVEPALDIAAIRAWSTRLLRRVVSLWALSALDLAAPLTQNQTTFVEAHSAICDWISLQKLMVSQAYKEFQHMVLPDNSELLTNLTLPLGLLDSSQLISGLSLGSMNSTEALLQPLGNAAFENRLETFAQGLFTFNRTMNQVNDFIQSVSVQPMQQLQTLLAGAITIHNTYIAPAIEIASRFGSALQDVTRNLAGFGSTITHLTQQWAPLFSINIWTRWQHELEQGKRILVEMGFGFIADLLPVPFLLRLIRIPRHIAPAVATNLLLAWTARPEFLYELQATFSHSPHLRRRWRIISTGFAAHKRRDYLASVPTLLPQVEGTLSDALALQNKIAVYGKHRIVLEKRGKAKLGRNQKHIKLPGMESLAQLLDVPDKQILTDLGDTLETRVAPERNRILHGHRTRYGTAKRSLQAILALFVLALYIVEMETQS